MADIKQKYKTPNGDNIIDKDFADLKTSGGNIGGDIQVRGGQYLDNLGSYMTTNFARWEIQNAQANPRALILEQVVSNNYTTFYPSVSDMDLGTQSIPWGNIWVNGMSKNATGYTRLTNGMIMQWGLGRVSIPANGYRQCVITLPIAFPNATLSHNGIVSWNFTDNGDIYTFFVNLSGNRADANSQIYFHAKDVVGYTGEKEFEIKWMAIGY